MQTFPANALLELSRTEGAKQPRTGNDWHWYADGDHGGAIPLDVLFLYRGQNRAVHPMLPSIARGLSSNDCDMSNMSGEDQAKIVLRLAQSWWFAKELQHHPITAHAKQQGLKLNRLGLAQHYGIPTGYLDLTHNFDVSAFFATCRATKTGWEPVTEGIGIVYRVDLKRARSRSAPFKPLGPQPLPRPDEQAAWVVELPNIHSFDGWPEVSIIQFEQNESVGQYFLNMFGGGELLFPPDPLTGVAREILESGEIPVELVEEALTSFASDQFGIKPDQLSAVRQSISSLIHLIAYRRLLEDHDIAPFMEDFEWRKQRLSDVKARVILVRTKRVQEEAKPPSEPDSNKLAR
jgi:hypothetical protein